VLAAFDNDRVTGFRVKPGPCELEHTWILGAWGDAAWHRKRAEDTLFGDLGFNEPEMGGEAT